jgi:cyclic pyranopterin phosphate synthase
MTELVDPYQRRLNYLRISITDRCNLRCLYCMPPGGVTPKSHQEILSYEEIVAIVRVGASLGIDRVRLTGGEPLVRRNLTDLVAQLRDLGTLKDLSLTTNGVYLAAWAEGLKTAGLDRVNISLDTLRPERFQYITHGGSVEEVLAGIEAAAGAELTPVKINTVAIRGFNDDELMDFVGLTRERPLHVRFIEFMPAGNGFWNQAKYFPLLPFIERLQQEFSLEPAPLTTGVGPAKNFRLPGACGTLGFITAVSRHFCDRCNRLRLTADGKLRSCLFGSLEVEIKSKVSQGEAAIRGAFQEALAKKPACGFEGVLPQGFSCRVMSQIGG